MSSFLARCVRAAAERVAARRPTAWIVGSIALCLTILATNVNGEFRSVRVKLPSDVLSSRRIALPLPAADRIRDPYLVIIYRLRNAGSEPLTVTARVGDHTLERSSLAAGDSTRVDISWLRSTSSDPLRVELEGSHGDWRLDYLELANLHGFTRGLVEFLILPAAQPFAPPPAWVYAVSAVWAAFFALAIPASLPRWGRIVHYSAAGLFLTLLAAAGVSSLVSPFRIVLAPHTFVFGLLLLVVPQALGVLQPVAVHLQRSATTAFRRLRRVTRHDVAYWLREVARVTGLDAAASRLAHAVRWLGGLPWSRVVGAGALVVYAAVVWTNAGAYAGGSDQSGYLNGARLLAEGRFSAPVRVIPNVPVESIRSDAYAPLGFRPADSDTILPTYPIGLPLVVAVAGRMGGLDAAAHHVTAMFALAGVLLIVWLSRECGLSNWGALLAALILATSPLYLFMSLQLMSDTPSLVWVTAAVLFAWHSRRGSAWALAAGASLAMAVLTRPPNILALVPVAVCLGLSPRRWLWLTAGGLPGAVLLARLNVIVYGAAVTTGYGDLSGLFSSANVEASVRNYATYLPVHLTPIGILALGLPVLLRRGKLLIAVLLSWIYVFIVFYAFYFHTHETWWYLRFVLVAFPALIVGSLLVGKALLERTRAVVRMRRTWWPLPYAAALLFTALILAHNVWWGRFWLVLDSGRGERTYFVAADWARRNLPPDAVVLAVQVSGCFFYYTDFPVLRWDYLDKDAVSLLQAEAVAGRQPLYAVLFPYEIEDRKVFRDHLRGTWTKRGAVEHISFWQFTGTTVPAAGEQ